jgi:hypothetical protein
MKWIILFSFVCVSMVMAQSDTVQFVGHQFVYQLDKTWEVASHSNQEGFLDILYKRTPIKDSKGIEVIPNLIIKLVKIASVDSNKSTKDSVNEIDMFTGVCLLNYAPPEVMQDYKHSKNLATDYRLTLSNSYGFNSPYTDNFKVRHTCLYFTVYDKDRYGVFICIDSTEEIFNKVKLEITNFLHSLKMI